MPTAFDAYLQKSHCKRLLIGCPTIDAVIGGIPTQGITEISGEAGAGKTQICLALALQCSLPEELGGLNGSTAYLCCGEGEFPIRRLQQLTSVYDTRDDISLSQSQLLSNVHIEKCYSSESIEETITQRLPTMCSNNNIKLVIIDSLAGIFRTEFNATIMSDAVQRTASLFKISSKLKWLADTFRVAVVVVNQVTASGFNSVLSSGTTHVPALGLAWSHCINSRITLHRDTQAMRMVGTSCHADDRGVQPTCSKRALVLEFSPRQPRGQCAFEIQADRIAGV
jgi:DNA-repair protein XRCC3